MSEVRFVSSGRRRRVASHTAALSLTYTPIVWAYRSDTKPQFKMFLEKMHFEWCFKGKLKFSLETPLKMLGPGIEPRFCEQQPRAVPAAPPQLPEGSSGGAARTPRGWSPISAF